MTAEAPTTLSQAVAANAARVPGRAAFVEGGSGEAMSWAEYHELADAIAADAASRHQRGARVAVQLPDGPLVHAWFVGNERAGVVTVGIGPRAGRREVDHLLARTGAVAMVTQETVVPNATSSTSTSAVAQTGPAAGREFGPDELWFLNSTSGTTGMPKVVMHHQRRWFAFHDLAVDAAAMSERDVFMSVLPAPFGFGLWTAHVTPTLLGSSCVVLERFSTQAVLDAIERYRVSVLAAVSTQFVMLLNDPSLPARDLSSLRVLFTGGEMVPYERAAEFEERTGATVLQFYGSNETGALSRTTLADDREVRLRTAGRLIDSMQVRLFDPDSKDDVTASGGPGVPACRGALTCLGYYDDPEANAALYTADGWMLTGDLAVVRDGVLTVSGRASDFIIRGGKNISAAEVEQEVATYPGVLLAAAVAKPDPVFGERVCVWCALAPGAPRPTLEDLRAHLAARGVGKELWPEHLELVEGDLPRSSGGKVAKGVLRERLR